MVHYCKGCIADCQNAGERRKAFDCTIYQAAPTKIIDVNDLDAYPRRIILRDCKNTGRTLTYLATELPETP